MIALTSISYVFTIAVIQSHRATLRAILLRNKLYYYLKYKKGVLEKCSHVKNESFNVQKLLHIRIENASKK